MIVNDKEDIIQKVEDLIDFELEFLKKHGLEHQCPVMSAEERIDCLINLRLKILSTLRNNEDNNIEEKLLKELNKKFRY